MPSFSAKVDEVCTNFHAGKSELQESSKGCNSTYSTTQHMFWQMAAMSSNTILSSTLHLRKLTFIVLVFKRCARLEHIPFESRVLRQKYTQNRQSTLATLVNNITHHQCEWQSLNFKTT